MSDVLAIPGVAQAKAEFIDDAERIGIDAPHQFPAEMAAINRLIERACAAAVAAHHAQVVAAVEGMKEAMRVGMPSFSGQTMCCDDCTHKLLDHLLATLAPTGGSNE